MAGGEIPELVVESPGIVELPIEERRVHARPDLVHCIVEVLRARGTRGRVALVGADCLPVKYARILERDLPGVEFVAADNLRRELRRHKSERELDCFREAGQIATKAHAAVARRASRGGTSAQAISAGLAELVKMGAPPCTIGVMTPHTMRATMADPLALSSAESLKRGDLFHAFLAGPTWQGYWCEPGASGVVGGTPSARQRQLLTKCVEILTRLLDGIKPGGRVCEIGDLGNRLLAEAGHVETPMDRQWPFFGHGIGLFWEEPWFFRDGISQGITFHAGQTVSVETYLYWPETGRAFAELQAIVCEGHNEVVTPLDFGL
jgi:Xaa-Pro aminopeptidase